VPVEEKETAKVENPAIKDSLGVYYSTFKLEKGKTYPFTTYQRDTQTMSDGSKSMTGTNESTDEMTFTVNSIDEKGNYDITMNLVGKECLLRLKEKPKALILKEVHQLSLNKNLCGKSKSTSRKQTENENG
jgi:hypothetical protein